MILKYLPPFFLLVGFLSFTPAAHSQWMFSAYLGKSQTLSSDLNVKQPTRGNDLTFHKIHYTNRSFKSPVYYGFRITYFFSPSVPFGIEEEFIHAKIYTDPREVVLVSGLYHGVARSQAMPLGDLVQEFSVSHGLNFLFTNLVGGFRLLDRRDLPFSPINFLLRVGVGPTIPHTESTIDSVHAEQYELNGPAFQLSAGLQGYLFWRLNFLLEYKFTYTNLKNVTIAQGPASATVRTHHFVFGLAAAL